jgi:hypothetical protein
MNSEGKSFLDRAFADGHAKLTGEGKTQRIVYLAVNHSERYSDPEEQVRAVFWAELISSALTKIDPLVLTKSEPVWSAGFSARF